MSNVNFMDARPGEYACVWDWPFGEFGWVASTEMFDDIDEPVTVTRKLWQLIAEERVTFHPRIELCPECHGDETVPSPAGIDIECPTCTDDPGRHPYAGQQEVLP